MKVQPASNQQTFKALYLPEYCKLPAPARAVVRKVDAKFKPQGIVYEAMFFDNVDIQREAAKMLLAVDEMPAFPLTQHTVADFLNSFKA